MAATTANETDDKNVDPFLVSMTFATVGGSGLIHRGGGSLCDCDECGVVSSLSTGAPQYKLPTSFVDAIRKHKKRKIMERTQERVLITRQDKISIWELTIPINSEPLVEFGSNHRIVFVKKLSKGSRIMSIGKGIIGSSDEEKSRIVMPWVKSKAYVIPSNGGKAVGLINTKDSTIIETTDLLSNHHVVLDIIKLPVDIILTTEKKNDKQEQNYDKHEAGISANNGEILSTPQGVQQMICDIYQRTIVASTTKKVNSNNNDKLKDEKKALDNGNGVNELKAPLNDEDKSGIPVSDDDSEIIRKLLMSYTT